MNVQRQMHQDMSQHRLLPAPTPLSRRSLCQRISTHGTWHRLLASAVETANGPTRPKKTCLVWLSCCRLRSGLHVGWEILAPARSATSGEQLSIFLLPLFLPAWVRPLRADCGTWFRLIVSTFDSCCRAPHGRPAQTRQPTPALARPAIE